MITAQGNRSARAIEKWMQTHAELALVCHPFLREGSKEVSGLNRNLWFALKQ
jgi:hypothetical protein